MSNDAAQTTKVVGYYNGKAWPIHLVISEFNLTLQLKPGDFIIDRLGNKINDPFFDRYPGQLSKEVSDNAVAIRRIPRINVKTPARDGLAVREVTQFTVDKRGQKTPVMPAPIPEADKPTVNYNPVKGWAGAAGLEEAKRLRLVKPVREVPENYGAAESDGMPSHGGGIPEIKYATDTVRTKAAPLPPQLTQVTEKEREKLTPEQIALASNLAETAKTTVVTGADEPSFGNPVVETAAAHAMAAQPPVAMPAPLPSTPVPEEAIAEEAVELAAGTPDAALPAPELPEPPAEEEAQAPAPAPAKTPIKPAVPLKRKLGQG